MQETGDNKCQCPPGFKGDGIKNCEGITIIHLQSTYLKGLLVDKYFLFQLLISSIHENLHQPSTISVA